MAAPGLERAGCGRLLARKHDPHVRSTVRVGRAHGEGAGGISTLISLLFSISYCCSLLADSIQKPEGREPIYVHPSQHPGTLSRWRQEKGKVRGTTAIITETSLVALRGLWFHLTGILRADVFP